MEKDLSYSRPIFGILATFAAAAVASIALQNLVWTAVALFLFSHFKERRKIDWPKGLFPLATLFFLFTFFLGAVVGVNPINSFQTVHKYLTFLMIFPIGAMALNLKEIQKLLLFFIYGSAFCALWGIGKHFFLHEDRINSFSGDKMVFGGMLMVSLLLVFSFLNEKPRSWTLWLCAGLMATALIFTQTRGAWLGLVLGAWMLLWRLNRRWFFASIALLAVIYFSLPQTYQKRIQSIGDIQIAYSQANPYGSASQTRFLIWAAGWHMIKDYPLGVGQGNVSDLFPKYRPPVLHEINEPHLHNNFLQLCAQNGWIGLAAYLFWIFSYYWKGLAFKPEDKTLNGLNWALLSVFSAVLVWGMTEFTFSHQFMNIQFFLMGLHLCLWQVSIHEPVTDQGV